MQQHPEARVNAAGRTAELAAFTREALVFLGTRGHLVVAGDGGVTTAGKFKPVKGPLVERSVDLKDAVQKAKFVGRWFALAGTPASVFQAWGVCP